MLVKINLLRLVKANLFFVLLKMHLVLILGCINWYNETITSVQVVDKKCMLNAGLNAEFRNKCERWDCYGI